MLWSFHNIQLKKIQWKTKSKWHAANKLKSLLWLNIISPEKMQNLQNMFVKKYNFNKYE